jgi:tryptophan 7-halogenase
MTETPITKILVCGGGIAGEMMANALVQKLPERIEVVLIEDNSAPQTDFFYGNSLLPASYDFHLSVGLSEPDLLLNGDAAFSYGTAYSNWAGRDLSWIQCHHLPLPVIHGVPFHHYLTQRGIFDLELFLVSAQAARLGSFAHPPEDDKTPLSLAEYGYTVTPSKYAALFARLSGDKGVRRISADVKDVVCEGGRIASLQLSDGQTVQADIYIDCTGPQAKLASGLGEEFQEHASVGALAGAIETPSMGPACRQIVAAEFGWQCCASQQQANSYLTVFHTDMASEAQAAHKAPVDYSGTFALGHRDQAWSGNCIAVGHAAAVFEPLTAAPLLTLRLDIERLLSLIPVSDDFSFECREYNRRFAEDVSHIELFQQALFVTDTAFKGSYWRQACDAPVPEKLKRKIDQFESRGLLVEFDLEPFNEQDWIILHYGMKRRPARYDRLADAAEAAVMDRQISAMRDAIIQMTKKMPPQYVYMTNLLKYLRDNHGQV